MQMTTAARPWPVNAFVMIGVLVILFIVALGLVYTHTREAYRSVGFNDGLIYQREQTLKKIERSVAIGDCRQYEQFKAPVEFTSVKSDSIFFIVTDNRSVQFCRRSPTPTPNRPH